MEWMASTTRYWKKTSWLAAAVLALVVLWSPPGLADGDETPFVIQNARVMRVDDAYQLSSVIDFDLNDTVLDALHNGVSLTIETQIRLYRKRDWLWDKEVSSINRRYRLRYFALSKLYLLTDLADDSKHSYLTLNAALYKLGHFHTTLVERHDVLSGQPHYLRMRIFLDIESLPAPLRPLAYLSSRWRLKSKWYQWTLQL
jgi:hypothetical protein